MRESAPIRLPTLLLILAGLTAANARAFEGHIDATISRGGPPIGLRYTVSTNLMLVETAETNRPATFDIIDRSSGGVTLVFPHKRCFVRYRPQAESSPAPPVPEGPPPLKVPPPGGAARTRPEGAPVSPGMPSMPPHPGLPEGLPPGIGPTNFFGTAGRRPAIPVPPMSVDRGAGLAPAFPMPPPGGGLGLRSTGGETNILGYACKGYEIKQWGQTMQIWATDQLVPFQDYLPNQPPGVGPPMIERQWSELLAARGLFPLRASLRLDNGMERYHFEVVSVRPARITADEARRFQTPEGYIELEPRPF